MKYLFIFLVPLTGCTHQTIHEYCTENANRYADYDQCYAERALHDKNRQEALSHMGDGFQHLGEGQPRRPAGY